MFFFVGIIWNYFGSFNWRKKEKFIGGENKWLFVWVVYLENLKDWVENLLEVVEVMKIISRWINIFLC